MPKIIIITGPPASGKSTITKRLAELADKGAVINVDDLRDMIKAGQVKPWEQKNEAKEQILLGTKNACTLAKNLLEAGFDVFIDDVIISGELINEYKKHLGKELKIIVLLPTETTITKRDGVRGPDDKMGKRATELHKKFFEAKDKINWQVIDNSKITIDETVQKIKVLTNETR